MVNWEIIKQHIEPDGSLIDIFITDFNKSKWIKLIGWLFKQKNIIQVNYYDSQIDKDYLILYTNY